HSQPLSRQGHDARRRAGHRANQRALGIGEVGGRRSRRSLSLRCILRCRCVLFAGRVALRDLRREARRQSHRDPASTARGAGGARMVCRSRQGNRIRRCRRAIRGAVSEPPEPSPSCLADTATSLFVLQRNTNSLRPVLSNRNRGDVPRLLSVTREGVGRMNTLWKVAALTVVAASVSGCYSRTREVVREQPIVQQQPVIERQTVVQQPVAQEPRVVERERVVVVQQPSPPAEQLPTATAPPGYSWVQGHYEWQNGNWVWKPGYWMQGAVRPIPGALQETVPSNPPRDNARWIPGHWSMAGNDWVWVRGHWL